MARNDNLPHWQLASIFSHLDGPDYRQAKKQLKEDLTMLEQFMNEHDVRSGGAAVPEGQLAQVFDELITRLDAVMTSFVTITSYLYGFITTDAFDDQAKAEYSNLQLAGSQLSILGKRVVAWTGGLDTELLLARSEQAGKHAYFVHRSALEATHLMGDEAEALLSALRPSSGTAWQQLHKDLISRDTIRATMPGMEEAEYPLTELRNLQANPEEAIRRAAWHAELELLERNSVAYAAAMNAIKGHVNEVSQRRKWGGALEQALFANALTEKSLSAMQEACRESFPVFRRYLRAKARFLGKEALAWSDLFAPVSVGEPRRYSWDEAKAFIIEHFSTYSEKLAAFAHRTFTEQWHDVPPRKGKTNGAYCMEVPGVKESRILLNFGGTLNDLFTLAHELGHAYHNECLYEYDRSAIQMQIPMTLAETASIFCETLVINAVLKEASDEEKLAVLEQDLLHSSQLVVDIYSRFVFESTVFERRRERELSIDEFKQIMLDAQAQTYAEALAPEARHPLMWALKGHYYSTGMSFYNYPYTFGYLFGLGLYAQYRSQPEGFHRRYDELLAATGMQDAASLARGFGFDIEDPAFWRNSLSVAGTRIEEYEALVEQFKR